MSIRHFGKLVSAFSLVMLCSVDGYATPSSDINQAPATTTAASTPSRQCYMEQATSELKNALEEANRGATPVEPSGKVCKVCEVEEYSGPPPRTVIFCYAVPCR